MLCFRNSRHNILKNPARCYSGKRHTVNSRPFRLGTQLPYPDGNPFGDYDVILPQEPFVFGVKHIPVKAVPSTVSRPPYTFKEIHEDDPYHGDPYTGDGRITLGSEDEQRLRNAAKLAKSVLRTARTWLKPGITTEEIDSRIHHLIVSNGAYPSPLGYAGFPKSCCTSVNNIIVHGIPDNRPLLDGDIVNIDITVFKEGFHGDTSDTFAVGNVDEPGLELIKITREALAQGIKACGPDKRFSDIGRKIHDFVAKYDYSINQQFTGHGIGKVFHRPPWILHTKNDEPGVMYPGHVFTIEPAIVQGPDSKGWLFPDGWAVSTESGARSAQAEHTVLITDTGVEVLTGDI